MQLDTSAGRKSLAIGFKLTDILSVLSFLGPSHLFMTGTKSQAPGFGISRILSSISCLGISPTKALANGEIAWVQPGIVSGLMCGKHMFWILAKASAADFSS